MHQNNQIWRRVFDLTFSIHSTKAGSAVAYSEPKKRGFKKKILLRINHLPIEVAIFLQSSFTIRLKKCCSISVTCFGARHKKWDEILHFCKPFFSVSTKKIYFRDAKPFWAPFCVKHAAALSLRCKMPLSKGKKNILEN